MSIRPLVSDNPIRLPVQLTSYSPTPCKLFKSFLLCGFYNYLSLLPSCISYPPSSFTQHSCAWCPSSYKIPVAAPIPASFSPIEMIEMFLLYLRTIPLLVLGFAYPPNFPQIVHCGLYFLFLIQSQFQFLTSVSHQQSAFTYEWVFPITQRKGRRKEWEKEGEKNSPLTVQSVLASASLWPQVSFHFLFSTLYSVCYH